MNSIMYNGVLNKMNRKETRSACALYKLTKAFSVTIKVNGYTFCHQFDNEDNTCRQEIAFPVNEYFSNGGYS